MIPDNAIVDYNAGTFELFLVTLFVISYISLRLYLVKIYIC